MKRKKNLAPKSREGRTDWKRLAKLSDAEIERMAARDSENPATEKADWAKGFVGIPQLGENMQ